MIKRLIFSFLQAAAFLRKFFQGNGTFSIQVIVGDWPHSKCRRRFLVIGYVNLIESEIIVQIGEKYYQLSQSPQIEFFRNLDEGIKIDETSYYALLQPLFDDARDLEHSLLDKYRLWEKFEPNCQASTPVVTQSARKCFIVEDGAHRLALQSLRGITSHRVAISIWYFGLR